MIFGSNAFATIADGLNQVAPNGSVTVYGGEYTADFAIDKALSSFEMAVNPSVPGETSVNITGDVTLNAVTTLAAGTVNVVFAGEIQGPDSLSVNSSGVTRFQAAVGGTASLASLTTDAAGSTQIGANVTTAGAQTYNDAVTLTADSVLTSPSGGNVTFMGQINGSTSGAQALTVTTNGTTAYYGAVGANTSLKNLTTDGGGTIVLGGNVTTSYDQSYDDLVFVHGIRTLTTTLGGTVSFEGTIHGNSGGPDALRVNSVGTTAFQGAVDRLTSLTTDADGTTRIGANVTTTGDQTYNDAVTFTGNSVLLSTSNGNVSFREIDGATAGAQDLQVTSSGTTAFMGAVGGTTSLASLTTDAAGSTRIGANVTTDGAQTYNDAVTITADTILTAPSVAFAQSLSLGTGDQIVTLQVPSAPPALNGVVMNLHKSGSTLTSDQLNTNTTTTLTYGGPLTVTASGDPLAQGDLFDLFDAASFSGAFSSLTLPPLLTPGLRWRAGTLDNTGAIEVSSAIVTNSNDSGPGSLRAAIATAEAGDRMTFSNDVSINLATPLTLTQNLTLDGTGHRVTLDGQNTTPIFVVDTGATVTLDRLTLTQGRATTGGALQNNGGTVTIRHSTFTGNTATNTGGALYNETGTLNVINSTFAGNNAPSGASLASAGGAVTLLNSSLAGTAPGGELAVMGGTVSLTNSLIDNDNATCAGPVTVTNGGHNLDRRADCGFAASHGSLSDTDPRLGTLGDYGGVTQTLPLLPGSPAIGAGDPDACAEVTTVNGLDQRGIARPPGAVCDIGAFESQGFTLAASGGSGQSTPVSTAFTQPLAVTVSAKPGSQEPVNGGQVTFTAPGSGASATFATSPATIAAGAASVTASANDTAGGPYSVSASAVGAATPVSFSLTNTPLHGACGSASGTTVDNAPSGAALCSRGDPTPASLSGAGPWTWQCQGRAGGTTATCSAKPTTLPPVVTPPALPPVSDWPNLPASDADTVPDYVEGFVPSPNGTTMGDGNGDGTADADQSYVTSIPAATTPGGAPQFLTLANKSHLTQIHVTASPAPADLPAGVSLPFGQLSFEVNGVTPHGGSVDFLVYVDASIPVNAYYKRDADGVWRDIATDIRPEGTKTRIEFTLTDGDAFDADGAENGTIVDPGGPAWMTRLTPTGIPTLSAWALLLLASLLGLLAWRRPDGLRAE
ncbi:hypothetical protein CCR95_03005 [Thiocystis minor]|nr:hypothetical protein [Thiocystis minor]